MSEVKPRRKSIFGGLLWVIIGSLLLANNLGARFGFWELLANWWPLILILLGLGKLFEHYASTRSGEPPARILSGGEVFFMILLFLAAGVYTGLVRLGNENDWDFDAPWWNTYTYTEEVTAKVAKPNSKINVTIPRGNLSVVAGDNPDIRVVVTKTIRATDDAEGQTLTDSYGVTVQESGGVYEIRPKGVTTISKGNEDSEDFISSRGTLRRSVRLDLEVHVPRQASVELRTERGGVTVQGVNGNVTTSSRGGADVEIRDVTGNVDAELRGGDVRVTNIKGDVKLAGRGGEVDVTDVTGLASVTGEFGGPIRMKNVAKEARFNSRRSDVVFSSLKGQMEMRSNEMEVYDAGSVNINTSAYDITLENPTGRVLIDNRNGNIELRYNNPPKEDVEVNNERADIEILMPPSSAFTVDASSRNGRAESDFKTGVNVTESDNDGRIQGTVGQRGPSFKLRSTHGTVRLREGARAVETQKERKVE